MGMSAMEFSSDMCHANWSARRREAFEALGGYTEDRGVGYEDWEFYARAARAGFAVDTVPAALYLYRFTPGSMQRSTGWRESRTRALRAYFQGPWPRAHEIAQANGTGAAA